ncbi:MAG TPA: diguanylate cyclase [Methanocorpusculum sp.]|nr:diguanylate cyclase [Methanocorpusculum sp.]
MPQKQPAPNPGKEPDSKNQLLSALSAAFEAVYYIDLEHDTCTIHQRSKNLDALFGDQPGTIPFTSSFLTFTDNYACEKDREKMRAFFKPETLTPLLAKEKRAQITYWMEQPDGLHTYSVTLTSGDGGKTALLTAVDISGELRRELSPEKRSETAKRIYEFDKENLEYIRDMINAGIWTMEYVNGKQTSCVWSPEFAALLGYEEEAYHETFEECCARIHPDDLKKLYGLIADALKKDDPVLKISTEARIRVKSGEYRWFSINGKAVRRPGATRVKALGILRDVNQVHEQKAAAEYERRNKEIIEFLAQEYSSVYYVDLETSKITICKVSDLVKESMGDDFYRSYTFSEALDLFLQGAVKNSDLDVLRNFREPEFLKSLLRETKTYRKTYRVGTETEFRYNEMKLVRVNDDGEPRAAVLGIADVDERVREAEANIRNQDLVRTLSSEYSSVYYVDLNTRDLTICAIDDEIKKRIGNFIFQKLDFTTALNMTLLSRIQNSDAEHLKQFGDPQFLKNLLKDRQTYTEIYRDGTEDNFEYFELKLVKVNEGPEVNAVVLGIANKDAEVRALKEKEIEEKRYYAVVKALSSEYSSVYYADIAKNILIPFHNSERITGKFGGNAFSGMNVVDAINAYVNNACAPADRENLKNALSFARMRTELAQHPYYTLIYLNDKNQYCEMKCVRGDEDATLHSVVVGFAVKDEEIRAKRTIEEEQKRNFEIIQILASEYSSVYYIDLETDGLLPYTMNADTQSAFGQIFSAGISYSAAFRMYVDKLVLAEDRKAMLLSGSITSIIRQLSDKKTFITTYRSTEGHYCEMKFVKVNDTGLPSAVALGFADRDGEIRREMELKQEAERNFNIIQILASEYSSVHYIDLATGDVTPYSMSGDVESEIGQILTSDIPYEEAFRQYVERFVHPGDREMVLSAGSIYSITRELGAKKTFITRYRSEDGRYCEMKFVKVDAEFEPPTAVALGFADKDDEIRAEEERERIQKRNLEIIDILASEYSSVYYIDVATGRLEPYTMNAVTESAFGKVFRSGITYEEAFSRYVDRFVWSADKEKILSAGSLANIVRELKSRKTFTSTYRSNVAGIPRYNEMKFVKIDDERETPTAIALGFADRDEEIIARYAGDVLLSDYNAVFIANLISGHMRTVKASSIFRYFATGACSYSDMLTKFAGILEPQYQKIALQFADPEFTKTFLANEDKREYLFTMPDPKNPLRRVTFQVLEREEGVAATVLISFVAVDNARAERIRQEAKLAEQMAVIAELTEDFDVVEYIELAPLTGQSIATTYRASPLLARIVPNLNDTVNSAEKFKLMRDYFVYAPDREKFAAATAREVILERLKKDSVYNHIFRAEIDGQVLYYQFKFTAVKKNGEIKGLVLGMHSVDSDMRAELALKEKLEKTVAERTADLEDRNRALLRMSDDIVELLGDVVESRDGDSGEHIKRVKGFTHILATRVMLDLPEYHLTPESVNLMTTASALHDVGKIMIPDAILLKPGKFTPEEFEVMKTHCQKGCDVLKKAPMDWSRDYLRLSLDVCMYHHEKWDGKGYPCGLKGDEIPIGAQIVSIADIYDALVSKRCYKDALSYEEAYQMIQRGECGAFSEKLMKCFAKCKDAFEQYAKDVKNAPPRSDAFRQSGLLLSDLSNADKDGVRQAVSTALAFGFESIFYVNTEDRSFVSFHSPNAFLKKMISSSNGGDFFQAAADHMKNLVHVDDTAMVQAFLDRAGILEKLEQGTVSSEAFRLVKGERAIYYRMKIARSYMDTHHIIVGMENVDADVKAHEELTKMANRANHDPLTGVGSAVWYAEKKRAMNFAIASGKISPFAIVECDANNLKVINDTLGHDKGDIYLKTICRTVCDICAHSRVFRTGGDEFVAVLEGRDFENREGILGELHQVAAKAGVEDMRPPFERAFFACGMAVFEPGEDKAVEDVFRRADAMMYAHKKVLKAGEKIDRNNV